MAAMSFATIDVVYLLICCQTKQNKSLARTVTVERAREGGREVAKGSPSYIASFGFSLQLRLQLQLEPQPLSSISFLSLCSFNSLSSFIPSPNFNSAPLQHLPPLNLQQRAHGNWLMATTPLPFPSKQLQLPPAGSLTRFALLQMNCCHFSGISWLCRQ